MVLAAERARKGAGAAEVGALTLGGRLRPARIVAGGDRLLQAGALGGVLRQRVAVCEDATDAASAAKARTPPPPSAPAMRVIAVFIAVNRPRASRFPQVPRRPDAGQAR